VGRALSERKRVR